MAGKKMVVRRFSWRLIGQQILFLVFGGGALLYTLWPWLPLVHGKPPRTLILYGFSILGEVMNEGVFPAFQAEWTAQTGEQVEFISAFASSGTVTNQMIMGVPAEVAILSLELDALRLVENGVLSGPTWKELPHEGVVNRTPFIILVRPDNPKQIADFADLTWPGVGVVHPDPLTSGGALWAILAEYGSVTLQGGGETAAYEQLLGIWRNVVAQAASARATRTQFETGFGDALITYEQEIVRDRARGRLAAEPVYPHSTILSEHTVVVLERNISPEQRELVDAFVAFLWGEQAQRIFVEYGFRSVDEALNDANPDFGYIAAPFVVADLGGWLAARDTIVNEIWKTRVLTELGR
ncbi:MAG: substrate-binding domain-containing protein [Anaerolinea sp.]|nr:substrate-binding domain-containing protein [Anaerolinea sp.]